MAQSLSNLPIGAKIKFGKHSVNGETAQSITWLVAARNHTGYPTNSVTLLTEKIIDLRCFDDWETGHPDSNIAGSGNNDYGLSNIDQWLNKSDKEWYSPTYEYDTPPNSNWSASTSYNHLPGFLYNFSVSERNALLSTTISYMAAGEIVKTISRKMFLPSMSEIGKNTDTITDGSTWAYFQQGNGVACQMTTQCYNRTKSIEKPDSVNGNWYWRTRSAYPKSTYMTYVVDEEGGTTVYKPMSENEGIRPAMNLSSTLSVSDTTDSDGCYTVVWNSAPPAPTTLTVPTIYGGKSATISWSGVTDPDGNSVTYQLEQSINDGAFTALYTGTNIGYTTIVPYGTTRVQYRVKATDSLGASSGYRTSSVITVINNTAPVISGSDGNLGTKTNAFTQTYSVTDANNNAVTITEAIDGVNLRSYTATLGATNTFSVTGNTWLTLANGIHTLTITATDGIDKSVRTYTFTKTVTSFTIQRATAIEASAKPARIKVTVIKTIPPEATFKVEVCNNGFDANPTWEDATSVVLSELAYAFTNTTKTATKWGVNIRVTVARNNGSGACYVTSIGGNWE